MARLGAVVPRLSPGAAALGCLLVGGCGDAGEELEPAVIVWIEVDTLRADALGAYGNAEVGEDGRGVTPELDRFASGAVLFEHAFATAPWTIPSVASQLTGAWPFDHGANALLEPLPASAPLLPEQFAAAGWRTAGVTTNFVTRGVYGFGRGFERFDDSLAAGHEGSSGSEAVGQLLEYADELGGGAENLFLFGLLFEPHFRYLAHPGRRFGPGFGSRAGTPYTGALQGSEELAELRARLGPGGAHTSEDTDFLRGLYTSDVARMDAAFGELRAGLEARGLWEQAWVVFAADHGEEFGEHGWIGHTTSLRKGMLHVPLIVKPPAALAAGRRGARVEGPVSLVDLPATLREMAGMSAAATSLLPAVLEGTDPERRFLYAYTRFEPVLQTAAASAKRSHRIGVIDAQQRLRFEVDRLAGDADGGVAFRPRLESLEGELLWAGEGPAPESLAPMLRLRGLLPEPLGAGESLQDRLEPDR